MRIAVIYNRDRKGVINLFGVPNKELIGKKTIGRLVESLKAGGHQVIAIEGDKDLIDRLEEFMPRVVKGERPGLAFNVSYGIQGQARYTHVPGILEMVGVPYVGSGPLAHSLALDKVVAKMIFRGRGIPTPDFAIIERSDGELPDLEYPLIVKPKNEAVSFGLKIVNDPDELRAASQVILDKFGQAVLVERYIDGREINVGLLGNAPPEALPPAELIFGDGPKVYTYEDKTHRSGREVKVECPARLTTALREKAETTARAAFDALGCYDCARVDMRLDADDNLYVLEINSLPSLGEHGSYVQGAAAVGLDFTAMVNRLVDVAAARYFGTPAPPSISTRRDPRDLIAGFLTSRRDRIERQVEDWTRISSVTNDPVGMKAASGYLIERMKNVGLKPVPALTDERSCYTWETSAGLENGTLLIAHLDVPEPSSPASQALRRDPAWLYGLGIGSSRAPLTCLDYALRALRSARQLRSTPLGVLVHLDEGRDARYSEGMIREAAQRAKRVLVMQPSNASGKIVTQRRGQRRFRFVADGEPRRPGRTGRSREFVLRAFSILESISRHSSANHKISVSVTEVKSEAFPFLLPHRVRATILFTYLDRAAADRVEESIRSGLKQKGLKLSLEAISDRPPMKERRASLGLAGRIETIAGNWEQKPGTESSVWPSVAGLVPARTAVVCGMGPVAVDLYRPHEAVQRISLLERTILLAEFLLDTVPAKERRGAKTTD